MEVFSMPRYTERTGYHPHVTTAHFPANCSPSPNMRGRPTADQTEYFPAGATLGKEKKKTKIKKQNSEILNPQPIKSFSMPCYTEKIGGLQRCQTPAPNLPRRHRQTGLEVKE
jgi:hypothetical protein